jgi:FAD/FMN-containing dehydrogenase
MEHPLRVDELSAPEAPRVAQPVSFAAPATTLPPLPNLPASDVTFLRPSDPHYGDFLAAANTRTQLSPALRAVCKTGSAVAAMVDWVRSKALSFAVRCGGHSYEGFSQSKDVVIDVRGMAGITVDKASSLVTIGSGASLYHIYQALAGQGLALQAGSCATVGISGHILGGGHGLLARSHGLTCDSIEQVTMVDSQGRLLEVSASSEPDLDWACKGGGGGSFGIATEFKLRVFPLKTTLVFGVTWTLSQAHAAKMFAAWQAFAPNAPSSITSILKIQAAAGGLVTVRCIGQSVGSEAELRARLQPLLALDRPSSALSIRSLGFLDAVTHFAVPLDYESVYMKAKSDYVLGPLGADAIQHMIAAVAANSGVALLCDAYGGKIADVAADATAFPRRKGTQFCIQYYSSWMHAADTPAHVAKVAKVYAVMRSFMPGASYVNYCDLDLPNYANAYWGANLPRLRDVKAQYDPDNLFQHAQSVPLPPQA